MRKTFYSKPYGEKGNRTSLDSLRPRSQAVSVGGDAGGASSGESGSASGWNRVSFNSGV